jgi:hypothetical protein
MAICESHCLPVKLHMKLQTEKAEAWFNFCIHGRSDESPDYRSPNQFIEANQLQTLPYLAVF